MTTPTPRTDALTKRMAGELDRPMLRQDHFIELCDHARQLERDLAAAREELVRERMAQTNVEMAHAQEKNELRQQLAIRAAYDKGRAEGTANERKRAAHICDRWSGVGDVVARAIAAAIRRGE